MLNWFESAISAVSPSYAARRALARLQVHTLHRMERRNALRYSSDPRDFDVLSSDPNDGRPRRIVDRATVLRLAAENPYGRKALNALVNNVVGWGITGSPKGPKAVQTLWRDWIKVADYRGRLNLYGLQELAVRTMFREGDSFLVRKFVAGPVLPLRIMVLDGGMLASEKFGDNIEDGIQYTADGNVEGYWFHQARPDYRRGRKPVFFKAEDVIHLFVQEYASQKRGRSIYEPIIKKLGDIDDALDADLVRRKIEACFVGFRTFGLDDDGTSMLGERVERESGESGTISGNLPPVEYFEPGMITSLAPGEDIKFGDPKPAGGLGEAVRIQLLAAAAGAGVTYEHMTGDLSNVNFSSYRAGALEFDAQNERIQWNTIIPVALDRLWGWFCEAGYLLNKLSRPSYEIRWAPPPRKSIDREGDAKADILEMQAGLENRRSLLNARGIDHDTFMEETAADLQLQEGKGLAFKGDPFRPGQTAAADAGND